MPSKLNILSAYCARLIAREQEGKPTSTAGHPGTPRISGQDGRFQTWSPGRTRRGAGQAYCSAAQGDRRASASGPLSGSGVRACQRRGT